MSGDMQEIKLFAMDALLDIMEPSVNIFGAGVMLRIFFQSFSTGVFNLKRNQCLWANMEFGKKKIKPHAFLTQIR